MVCAGLEVLTDTSIKGFLQYPTTCNYYFYAYIIAAFFFIVAIYTYRREKENFQKSDFLSSMGVSAIATIMVSLAARLIGFLQPDVFIEILVICCILIGIWFMKGES